HAERQASLPGRHEQRDVPEDGGALHHGAGHRDQLASPEQAEIAVAERDEGRGPRRPAGGPDLAAGQQLGSPGIDSPAGGQAPSLVRNPDRLSRAARSEAHTSIASAHRIATATRPRSAARRPSPGTAGDQPEAAGAITLESIQLVIFPPGRQPVTTTNMLPL